MATLIFFHKFMLSCALASLFLISHLQNGRSRQVRQSLETLTTHSFHLSSLIDTTFCKLRPEGRIGGSSSLKLVHKFGPCIGFDYSHNRTSLDSNQILLHDQSRVAWINSQKGLLNSDVTIPANDGRTIGLGNYIVTIGLGTPSKNLTLAFDTGSSLTWTQCKPCTKCYHQKDPIFDPASSQSFANVSCNSQVCSQVRSATSAPTQCSSTSACNYIIQYSDNSTTSGTAAKETLTISPTTDVFDNFYFGCGHDTKGLFQGSAGILGLGRGNISIVSQTAQKYNQFFTYCIPSSTSSTGHLTFGKEGVSNSMTFTSLSTNPQYPSFYFVELIGITVGSKNLSIPPSVFSNAGTIIDSGTVISRLPPTAYAALRSAFREQMSNYSLGQSSSLFDTCYDFSKFTNIYIPEIILSFSGGVDLNVDPSGILYRVSSSLYCLAFAGNSNDSELGVLGNTQQKTFAVAYDVAGGRIGFGPGGCD